MEITQTLYKNDPESPYDGEIVGFTAAAIEILCKELGLCLHVKWGNSKIIAFTTESLYQPILMEIFSDHAYFLNAMPKEFLKAEVEQVTCKDLELVAGIKRKANVIPGGQYWESYSELKPGHFRSANLHSIRTDFLEKGISPKVSLNGMGNVKRLKYGECMIHSWPAEAHVCMSFLEELSLVKPHSLVYRGESLAAFTMGVV